MKFFICLLCSLLAVLLLKAQGPERRGYVGINLGASYLLNAIEAKGKAGANVNLINAGYFFKSNFGITLKWMGGAHTIADDNGLAYGAILIGPMYSIPISERTSLDVKFASGIFWVTEKVKLQQLDPNDPLIVSGRFEQSARTLSLTNFAAGLAVRHSFAKSWTVLILTEYNSGKTLSTSFLISEKHLQALNLNAGIAFRF